MGKFSFGKVLDSLCLSSSAGCCFCSNSNGGFESEVTSDDEIEKRPLCRDDDDADPKDDKRAHMLKDLISGPPTLAFQLKPKMVVLRVSMHCYGCAKKVEKHISKMEGVTSYQVNLETKTVVVIGDIIPFEILESVSKLKYAELLSNATHSD
ncbi:hypothetical protein DM860_015566 [Cuscuta australis]|uniref:HMA domain-containing protein n=1 Tax=Cuscuta australis TaxID=267555 RepID=A0A328EA93_9ASTE|nr:hypothetical protein DM860_015566 [Cuscuta australis]